MKENNNVLLEIGVEELPARFIDDAANQLKIKTKEWLNSVRIPYEAVRVYSSPRRLAVCIEKISDQQTTVTEELRGPQVKIAKDDQGNWTKAAIGFTKGQGKHVTDIYTKIENSNEYIFIEKKHEGKQTETILPQLKKIVDDLQFPQTMQWGNDSYKFARPIRWLVAMYNEKVIPFNIANVKTGNKTFGHRFLGKEITLTDPVQYEALLKDEYVIVDPLKREQRIMEGIKKLEEKTGFRIAVDEPLLKEVRNLIEYPTVFYGSFSEEYLTLPKEVLITSMKEHQRYFPVLNEDATALLPYFVSVRNGNDGHIDNVVRGNEKVLRARLADAAFFYEEDKKQSIDFYNEKLKTVVFQEKIGTIFEKTAHIVKIAEKISERLHVSDDSLQRIKRAAEICKFDLMTNMVNEFTELQGIIGEKYALYFGEHELVAKAIKEHYLPVKANGTLPETLEGSVISIADKLDTIIGCFSVGLKPTGSQDQYGLRRQANGILNILRNQKWNISLEELISMTYDAYSVDESEGKADVQQFFRERATYLLTKLDIEQDVIRAAVAKEIGIFHYAIEKAVLLSDKRNEASFKTTQEALVRVLNVNQTDVDAKAEVDSSLFQTESEATLYETYQQVEASFHASNKAFDAQAAFQSLEQLTEPIHHFFEHNMVMAKEASLKQNRLALIARISELIHTFADLSLIEWKQHHS